MVSRRSLVEGGALMAVGTTAALASPPAAIAAVSADAADRAAALAHARKARIWSLSGSFRIEGSPVLSVWVDNQTKRYGDYIAAPAIEVASAAKMATDGSCRVSKRVKNPFKGKKEVRIRARMQVRKLGKRIYTSPVKAETALAVPKAVRSLKAKKARVTVNMGQ